VLDTRTQRDTVALADAKGPPELIHEESASGAMARPLPMPGADTLVILIAPGPVFGVPLHEAIGKSAHGQRWSRRRLSSTRLPHTLTGTTSPSVGLDQDDGQTTGSTDSTGPVGRDLGQGCSPAAGGRSTAPISRHGPPDDYYCHRQPIASYTPVIRDIDYR
jgi:hypothetical protein